MDSAAGVQLGSYPGFEVKQRGFCAAVDLGGFLVRARGKYLHFSIALIYCLG